MYVVLHCSEHCTMHMDECELRIKVAVAVVLHCSTAQRAQCAQCTVHMDECELRIKVAVAVEWNSKSFSPS